METILIIVTLLPLVYLAGYRHGRRGKPLLSVAFLLLLSGQALASPQSAVAAALADARQLPPGIREQTRYLDLSSVPAGEQREEFRRVLAFHVNSLSREGDIVQPRRIGDELLAVTLLDYAWDPATWERFQESDPYFHVQTVVRAGDRVEFWQRDRKGWFIRRETKAVVAPALAPWLSTPAILELVTLTNSAAPILRGDWFFAQTVIQDKRIVGYYDMLGLGKKQADFEKLVGLDRAAATRLKKEVQAVVQSSSVALHNRHVVRFQTLTGAYWETRDAKDNTDVRNALRLLNGDFKHDALEIYGTLPNGLFAFFLSNAQGVRADTAPDDIAADGRASGTDRRVHVGLSCVRCHVEGIRPIDDWARKLYRGDVRLDAVDPVRFIRLRQLYQSDLDGRVKRDQEDYAEVLKRVNGLAPAANAKAVASVWEKYSETAVGLAEVSRETGYPAERIEASVKARAAAGLADPILSGLIQRPVIPVRREHFEELMPLLMHTLETYR